jgi:hypothetical protein
MVKLPVLPLQPLATGVTVTKPSMGDVPVLVAVNGAMLPVPGDARPIAVLLFTQLYVVPLTAPVKVTGAVVALLHKVWLATVSTVGVG